MAISFFLQSNKNPAPIYIRIREGVEIDAKTKTNLLIDPLHFKKGTVKLHKNISGSTATVKKEIQAKNNYLNNIQKELDKLRSSVTESLNSRKDFETVNSKWLKNLLNPTDDLDLPKDLVSYFDFYLESKKSSLQPSTVKKNKVFKHRVEKYQDQTTTVYLEEVNKKFSRSFQNWCLKEGYAHNTIVKTLKFIKTVCLHAKENGIATNPELDYIAKGMKYIQSEHIHLNFDELEKIALVDLTKEEDAERLDNARDWLLISCFTAQRVSDFLRFTSKEILFSNGIYYLLIKQKKTGKPVQLPIQGGAFDIVITKRQGNFPPVFSNNTESNATIYNKLIKEVCRLAEINENVIVERKNKKTNRYEKKEMPKHKAVSTHIGRRSFATNFYSHIDTSLLIAATGHSSEAQFLQYVQKAGNQNAHTLSLAMNTFLESRKQEPKLQVIRNASNQ